MPSDFPTMSFHMRASRLKESAHGEPFALQIGAMDGVSFDLLYPHLSKGGWQGLLVEPVADMFQKLQKNYADHPSIRLANCAVGEHDGTLTLRRIKPEVVEQGLLPPETLGMTGATGKLNDATFVQKLPIQPAEHLMDIQVPCLTLPHLLQQNGVARIDLVVIDTEGTDWIIARQLDLTRYRPAVICIEHSGMPPDHRENCVMHFLHNGYKGALCTEDPENFLFWK